jgi:SAM-dependent methyltransferase
MTRAVPPGPWSDGDNIPWDEPGFSQRMLREHLSQDHDLASRRLPRVEEQVAAMAESMLPAPPARVLDLACGPGLYLRQLAVRGYSGTGIDFSPASIDHAKRQAETDGLATEYRLDDLRTADFGAGFEIALLLYGQLNVFRRPEAESLVTRAGAALQDGGVFIVELQTYEQIQASGHAPATWSSHETGLFSPLPHILLTESFWDEDSATSTQRFYVVDTATAAVSRHALSNEAYTEDQLETLFAQAGFADLEYRSSLTDEAKDDGLMAVVARKN